MGRNTKKTLKPGQRESMSVILPSEVLMALDVASKKLTAEIGTTMRRTNVVEKALREWLRDNGYKVAK